MHPQLMLLLEIQDLHTQEKSFRDTSDGTSVEEEHFHIDAVEARAALVEKIQELEEKLDPGVRIRYQRILESLERAVVPVINGVCYGCFVSIPTATAGESDTSAELQVCEQCGRFIYILS